MPEVNLATTRESSGCNAGINERLCYTGLSEVIGDANIRSKHVTMHGCANSGGVDG